MIPIHPVVGIYVLLIYLLLAAGIGIMVGIVTCFALNLKPRFEGLLGDSGVGAVGFLMAFWACVFFGWPRPITNDNGHYPIVISLIPAVLLPVINRLWAAQRTRFRSAASD